MSPSGRAEAARLRRAVADIEAVPARRAARRAPPPPHARHRRGARRRACRRRPARDRPRRALGRGGGDGLCACARGAVPEPRPAALLIGEGFAARETGALYGPGLVAHGLPLSRLVFVEAPDANAALWAMEEALKCGGPAAVVGEIWNLKHYSLAASRRLLLAARKGRTPALIVLASAYGQAGASPAPPRRGSRSPLCRAQA